MPLKSFDCFAESLWPSGEPMSKAVHRKLRRWAFPRLASTPCRQCRCHGRFVGSVDSWEMFFVHALVAPATEHALDYTHPR